MWSEFLGIHFRDNQFYTSIIEPHGFKAKDRNEAFLTEYGKVVTRFTAEFIKDFCSVEGEILWNKLVQYNSGISKGLEPSVKNR